MTLTISSSICLKDSPIQESSVTPITKSNVSTGDSPRRSYSATTAETTPTTKIITADNAVTSNSHQASIEDIRPVSDPVGDSPSSIQPFSPSHVNTSTSNESKEPETNIPVNFSFEPGAQVTESAFSIFNDQLPSAGHSEHKNECSSPSSSTPKICSQHMPSRHLCEEMTSPIGSMHALTEGSSAGSLIDSPEAQQETNRSHSSESFVSSNPKLHRSISCPKCMRIQINKLERELKESQDQKNQHLLQECTQQLEIVNLKSTYEAREKQHLQERNRLGNEVYERDILIRTLKAEYSELVSARTEQDTRAKQLEEEIKDVKCDYYDLNKELRKEKQPKIHQCPQCNLKFKA